MSVLMAVDAAVIWLSLAAFMEATVAALDAHASTRQKKEDGDGRREPTALKTHARMEARIDEVGTNSKQPHTSAKTHTATDCAAPAALRSFMAELSALFWVLALLESCC